MSVDDRIVLVTEDKRVIVLTPALLDQLSSEMLVAEPMKGLLSKMPQFDAACLEQYGRPPSRADRRAEARRLRRRH